MGGEARGGEGRDLIFVEKIGFFFHGEKILTIPILHTPLPKTLSQIRENREEERGEKRGGGGGTLARARRGASMMLSPEMSAEELSGSKTPASWSLLEMRNLRVRVERE